LIQYSTKFAETDQPINEKYHVKREDNSSLFPCVNSVYNPNNTADATNGNYIASYIVIYS